MISFASLKDFMFIQVNTIVFVGSRINQEKGVCNSEWITLIVDSEEHTRDCSPSLSLPRSFFLSLFFFSALSLSRCLLTLNRELEECSSSLVHNSTQRIHKSFPPATSLLQSHATNNVDQIFLKTYPTTRKRL